MSYKVEEVVEVIIKKDVNDTDVIDIVDEGDNKTDENNKESQTDTNNIDDKEELFLKGILDE